MIKPYIPIFFCFFKDVLLQSTRKRRSRIRHQHLQDILKRAWMKVYGIRNYNEFNKYQFWLQYTDCLRLIDQIMQVWATLIMEHPVLVAAPGPEDDKKRGKPKQKHLSYTQHRKWYLPLLESLYSRGRNPRSGWRISGGCI